MSEAETRLKVAEHFIEVYWDLLIEIREENKELRRRIEILELRLDVEEPK